MQTNSLETDIINNGDMTKRHIKEKLGETLTEISRRAECGFIVSACGNITEKTGWNYTDRNGEILQGKSLITVSVKVTIIS